DGDVWFISSDGWTAARLVPGHLNPSTGSVEILSPFSDWSPAFTITTTSDGNLWIPVETNAGMDRAILQFNPNSGATQYFDEVPTNSGQEPTNGSAVSNNSLSATGTKLSTNAGVNFVGAVAVLTPRAPIPASGSAYQTTIEWGDGQTSAVILTVMQNATYD